MRSLNILFYFFISVLFTAQVTAQSAAPVVYVLKPDRVFDGEAMHEGWMVLVKDHKIEGAGLSLTVPPGAKVIELKGCTLLPGLIEGHSHLFLHPYSETPWDDQVLKEPRAERTARAVNHAKATLLAGFTMVRDLGTEGAMYDDVGLKKAIEKGIIPGPRMLVATRAIVATGSYGPKAEVAEMHLPKGAAEAGGPDELSREIRTQIGQGADLIKLYGDYRWGLHEAAQPTFTEAEMALAVSVTKSSGRQVVVHAATPEGMRRAVLAGVSTIEHGDKGDSAVFRLMKDRGVALCPTLAAGYTIAQNKGWKPGTLPEPDRIVEKRKSFAAALAANVTICMGGDAGVFSHGDNALEMELMVGYGMKPLDVLRSATSVNADVFGINKEVGRISVGLDADIVVVEGNPANNIAQIRKVKLVMQRGAIVRGGGNP